jgi:hypothetical protein
MNLTDEQWALIQPLISSYILSGAEEPVPVTREYILSGAEGYILSEAKGEPLSGT